MIAKGTRHRRQRQNAQMPKGIKELSMMIVVMVVVTIALVWVVRFVIHNGPAADKFCEGVYINGLSLGGKSYEEGKQLVFEQVTQRLNHDSFLLIYGDRQWMFTLSDFDAKLDLSTELNWAWNYGHTGTDRDKREQAEYVKNNPQYYTKEIEYDQVRLEDFLAAIKAEIDIPAVEASVIAGEDEILTISPSRDGQSLSVGSIKKVLEEAIMNGTNGVIDLAPYVVPKSPVASTETLESNTQLIATHWTPTNTSSTARTKNIRRVLSAFDGFILLPGQTVSFNDVVGVRTKANGFYKSPEYDGTEIIDGIGGGVCQASTTLYCALLKADMVVGVRYPHTMSVGYCKPSLDAAVSSKKDLVFTNFKDYPIYIYTQVDTKRATVNIYGQSPEYNITLESELIGDPKPAPKSRYVDDTESKYVYYTDERFLIDEGKDEVKSRGFRVYHDKLTGEEVDREDLGLDTYYAKQAVYWRGVHKRGAEG